MPRLSGLFYAPSEQSLGVFSFLEPTMIVMHNFKEAYQLYRQGRIPHRLLQDQAFVLIGMGNAKRPSVTRPPYGVAFLHSGAAFSPCPPGFSRQGGSRLTPPSAS
jgi:hypothetical protein